MQRRERPMTRQINGYTGLLKEQQIPVVFTAYQKRAY